MQCLVYAYDAEGQWSNIYVQMEKGCFCRRLLWDTTGDPLPGEGAYWWEENSNRSELLGLLNFIGVTQMMRIVYLLIFANNCHRWPICMSVYLELLVRGLCSCAWHATWGSLRPTELLLSLLSVLDSCAEDRLADIIILNLTTVTELCKLVPPILLFLSFWLNFISTTIHSLRIGSLFSHVFLCKYWASCVKLARTAVGLSIYTCTVLNCYLFSLL